MAKRKTTSREGLRRVAVAHERAGRLEPALQCWLQFLDLAPGGGDVQNRVGDLYEKLGRTRKAVRSWADAALRYREEGFLHKAVAVLRKASRKDPTDTDAQLRVANLHVELGYGVEAKRLYLKIAEEGLRRGDARALEALERLVGVDGDLDARRTLARLYEQRGDAAKGAAHYLSLAEASADQGRPGEAREALERAHALAPADRAVRAALADAYRQGERWQEAARLYEALAEPKAEASVALGLGQCYAALHRFDEARQLYAGLLAREPQDDELQARLALLAAEEGDADRALDELAGVLDRLVERGDAQRAAELLEQLLRRGPHVRSLLRLGVIYNALGDREALQRTYDGLIETHRERGDSALEAAAAQIRASLAGPVAGPVTPPAPSSQHDPAGLETRLERAAELIGSATCLLIAAGSGLNVGFGWPDYRDERSFWTAFPACETLGFGFDDLARPERFALDPALAWGFYARRLEIARTRPLHAGFEILARWRSLMPGGGFVVASCVDGEFQRAGFDAERVVECCGSIEWLQCTRECGKPPFPAADAPSVEMATLRARPPFPSCPGCGALARPSVLMFGDWDWDMSRITAQDEKLRAWLRRLRGLVVVACGETPRQPALPLYVRRLAKDVDAPVVRIGAEDLSILETGVSVPLAPHLALARLDQRIG